MQIQHETRLIPALALAFVVTALPAVSLAATAVSVDAGANVRPFSPLIFGVAFGEADRNAVIGYPLRRWGGNSVTRYNWKVDTHNSASDWYFENIPGSHDRTHVPPLNNEADAFINEARSYGADVLMTIPTIGWVPRADSPLGHPYAAGFSITKYGAQQSSDPWDTDAGNGRRPNNTVVTANDPLDTSIAVTPAFQKEWVAHMQANGGVHYYSLDNEVMLWNSTHRDVHPAPTTYDETWNKALAYGTAIKQQDPTAKVTGPVTWGYCDLFGSAADNCVDGADRQAHGGIPFVAWYLQQVCAHPLAGGAHVVDYLDLHYYPQGAGITLNDDDSAATSARRLRSLKELYDPAWVSESWFADLGGDYAKPKLIPRARAWIDQYCPGTQLAITEYNWSGDNASSGAVAQAELFGIFARDGVDMATRWVAPEANTKVERAFVLFLNYDGAGAKVQGSSVAAQSANVDQLGAYAFTSGARTMVLLTNKTTSAQDVNLNFASAPGGSWKLYGFDATHAVHQISSGTLTGNSMSVTALPAMSGNLLVVSGGDQIFKNGFD